jgi:hypothetical protein
MERTDLLDTDIRVHRLRIKLLREKSPDWRLQKAIELSDMSRQAFPEQTLRALKKSMRKPVE